MNPWSSCTARASPAGPSTPSSPLLAAERDVIAVDLPGHGESPRQPKGAAGTPPSDLAVAVGELLDELGLTTAHVAGNSSGGWVALELGRSGRARTVTALAPAGLWRRSAAPLHIRAGMRQSRLSAKVVHGLFPNAPRSRAGRALAASQVSGHPFHVPYQPARDTVHAMASAPGFRETLRALEKERFTGGGEITVPVTVAWGTRDRVLLPGVARHRDQLRPDALGPVARVRSRPDVRRPGRDRRVAVAGERPGHRTRSRQAPALTTR